MLNMYVGKNIVKVDETDLLGMDIAVLKSIPYSIASKYADYISAIEVCVEDCLDITTDIKDEASYLVALAELESIIKEDEVMDASNTKLNKIENKKEEVIMNGSNITIETINEKEMVSMMENVAKEMNGEVKGFGKVKEAFNNFKNTSKDSMRNIMNDANRTKERYIDETDEDFNNIKDSFVGVLNSIGEITGLSTFVDAINAIIEAGTDGKTSKKDLFKMAEKCSECIEEEIEFIKDCGDEEDLKRVLTLKSSIENGRGKNIFEMFAAVCVWIANKITAKFASWGAKGQEKNVFGTICRSIAKVASLLRSGVTIIFKTGKFIASFVVAGIIKIGDIIFRAIRSLYNNIKEFIVDKITPDYVDDIEEDLDDDFFDDDEE